MSTDDPDADDLPPAVRETLDSLGGALGDIAELDKEQLSETIGLLETLGHDQAAGILHSRREVLKGAGAATGLGIAGLAGASATGTASAGNDQAGTVGSQAAPLDGYVEDLYDKNGNRVAELPGDGSLDVLQELSSQSVSTDEIRTAPTGALVQLDGSQSIANDTVTEIEWAEETNRGNVSNLLSDNAVVIPNGFEYAKVSVSISPIESPEVDFITARRNGESPTGGGAWATDGTIGQDLLEIQTAWISVSENDQITAEMRQVSGGSIDLSDNNRTYMEVWLL